MKGENNGKRDISFLSYLVYIELDGTARSAAPAIVAFGINMHEKDKHAKLFEVVAQSYLWRACSSLKEKLHDKCTSDHASSLLVL